MTTNLVECINSILRGARSLLIFTLVTKTFETIKDWFVQQDTKVDCRSHMRKILLSYCGKMNNNLLCVMLKDMTIKTLILMSRR